MLTRFRKKLRIGEKWDARTLLKLLYFNLVKINRFNIYEIDLGTTFETAKSSMDEWDFRVIEHHELRNFRPPGDHPPREYYMNEIDGVRRCVVAVKDDTVASISWLYLKGDPNRWFALNDREAQVNYVYTFPAFRGKGLCGKTLMALAGWLKQKNYQRLLIEVHEGTGDMISCLKKVPGVEQIGILTHWCFYRPKWSDG
jgi:GNAT superfamily N-acetyltransferase